MSIDTKGHYRGAICGEAKVSKHSLFRKHVLEGSPTIHKCSKDFCVCMGNRHVLKYKNKKEALERLKTG